MELGAPAAPEGSGAIAEPPPLTGPPQVWEGEGWLDAG
jgi:hypothetical protein